VQGATCLTKKEEAKQSESHQERLKNHVPDCPDKNEK